MVLSAAPFTYYHRVNGVVREHQQSRYIFREHYLYDESRVHFYTVYLVRLSFIHVSVLPPPQSINFPHCATVAVAAS